MTLVQNLRLPLNGNNPVRNLFLRSLFLLGALSMVVACTPRVRVIETNTEQARTPEETVEEERVEAAVSREVQQIALLLPFQLNRSTGSNPTQADIQRAALALDFLQGFQLGLEKSAGRGGYFKLEVLDSRDNEQEVSRLAASAGVKEAALIVGPVYPKEIKAFAQASGIDPAKVLQVSPLAATMPSEFNQPNLISITSPITTHVKALAKHLKGIYRSGDVVILYESEEASSQQFLPALRAELQLLDRSIPIHQVDSEERLLERVRLNGNNLIVCGSTNRFRLVSIFNQLHALRDMNGHRVQLFGHPTWAKMSFEEADGLESLQTMISSSYYIDPRLTTVRDFNQQYREEFEVAPTEFAYKGYDTGRYFGELLSRYGKDYSKHLLDATYQGLHNDFEFEYNPRWGYVNHAIHFLKYNNGSFIRSN